MGSGINAEDISKVFGTPTEFIDISPRVAQALAEDTRPGGGRRKLTDSLCPSFMMDFRLQFIGTSAMVDLRANNKTYAMALFQKNMDAADLPPKAAREPPVKQDTKVMDFMWAGYFYIAVYLSVSLWSEGLERYSGLESRARPLGDYLLIGFNSLVVFINVVMQTYLLRDNPPCGVSNFLLFFVLFDAGLYSVHRYIMHGSKFFYKKFHAIHHSRERDMV